MNSILELPFKLDSFIVVVVVVTSAPDGNTQPGQSVFRQMYKVKCRQGRVAFQLLIHSLVRQSFNDT